MAHAQDLILQEDDIDFEGYLRMTDTQHRVRPVHQFRQELHDETLGISDWGRVAYLPWGKTRETFQFRRGEVTMWIGFNGHGKSLLLGMVMLSLMSQGEVVLILSFEMKPRRTLARMLRQWGGRPLPSMAGSSEVDQFVDWCEGKCWVYDQQGMVDPAKVIAVMVWAIVNKGVTHILLDNVGKCCRSEEDFDGQKDFIDRCTVVARDHNVHVHVVHHPRKAQDESKPPRKQDAKGSGAMTDQVDNVGVVWRNIAKAEARQRGDILAHSSEPDALVLIDKQRNGEGWLGRIGLAFHQGSNQFIDMKDSLPLDLVTRWPHANRDVWVRV